MLLFTVICSQCCRASQCTWALSCAWSRASRPPYSGCTCSSAGRGSAARHCTSYRTGCPRFGHRIPDRPTWSAANTLHAAAAWPCCWGGCPCRARPPSTCRLSTRGSCADRSWASAQSRRTWSCRCWPCCLCCRPGTNKSFVLCVYFINLNRICFIQNLLELLLIDWSCQCFWWSLSSRPQCSRCVCPQTWCWSSSLRWRNGRWV